MRERRKPCISRQSSRGPWSRAASAASFPPPPEPSARRGRRARFGCPGARRRKGTSRTRPSARATRRSPRERSAPAGDAGLGSPEVLEKFRPGEATKAHVAHDLFLRGSVDPEVEGQLPQYRNELVRRDPALIDDA